jgi:hypothetical protein
VGWCDVVRVTFERTAGQPIAIQTTRHELTCVAGELNARCRQPLAQRLLAATDERAKVRIVISDYDVPMLVAAIAATRQSVGLSSDWARLRDL